MLIDAGIHYDSALSCKLKSLGIFHTVSFIVLHIYLMKPFCTIRRNKCTLCHTCTVWQKNVHLSTRRGNKESI